LSEHPEPEDLDEASCSGSSLSSCAPSTSTRAEAQAEALQIIPVFQSQPLPAGGQKAMLYLEMALQDDLADADLLRRTARYLRELQHDSDARFRPRA
jgi:hypothetical protein